MNAAMTRPAGAGARPRRPAVLGRLVLLGAAAAWACSSGGAGADDIGTPEDASMSAPADGGAGDGGSDGAVVGPGTSWTVGLLASECRPDVSAAGVAPDGALFLGGTRTFESFPTGCRPDTDALVAKVDATGKYVGAVSFGYDGDQVARGLAVHGGGGPVVVGDFDGKVLFGGGTVMTATGMRSGFVVKLEPLLRHIWSRQIAATKSAYALAVAVDGGGAILVGGRYAGTADLGGGELSSTAGNIVSTDAFLLKLDAGGAHVFSKGLGDSAGRPDPRITGDEAVNAVTTDAAGNIYLAGYFEQTIDLGGGALKNPTPSVVQGYKDIFVAKLDPTGRHLWSRRFGQKTGSASGGYHFATQIALERDGGLLIGGTFRGTLELGATVLDSDTWDKAFVARLDGAGAPLWAQALGEYNASFGGVAQGAAGSIALGGGFSDRIVLGGKSYRSTGQTDGFAARLDRGGALLASQIFSDSRTHALNEDQAVKAIAVDAAGAVLSAGTYRDAVDYGGGEIVSIGKSGIFVSRLAP